MQNALSLDKGTPILSYFNSHVYITALLKASCCFSRTFPTTSSSSTSAAGSEISLFSRAQPQAMPITDRSSLSTHTPILEDNNSLGNSALKSSKLSQSGSGRPLHPVSSSMTSVDSSVYHNDMHQTAVRGGRSGRVTKRVPIPQDERRFPRQRHQCRQYGNSCSSPITAGEGSAYFKLSGSAMASHYQVHQLPGNVSPGSGSASNSPILEKKAGLCMDTDRGIVQGSSLLQSWVWVSNTELEPESGTVKYTLHIVKLH